jgi:competence protein ComEA
MLERYKNIIFAAVIIVIVAGIVALLTYRPAPTVITIIPPAATGTPLPTSTPGPVHVYITGAVAKPGTTHDLPAGSRVQDVITAAGGASSNADMVRVNIAQVVRDGDQIHVPTQIVATPKPGASNVPLATPNGPIHINTATEEELQQLPGVGPALAKEIAAYRKENGPFKSMEDLDKVPGIGPARLKEWEGKIAFD